jgi:general stress protein YciG
MRGFAVMPKELVIELARKGGIAAHEMGVAHEFTTEEARAAGKLGGTATRARRLITEVFEDVCAEEKP